MENALLEMDNVKDVAVIGMPNPILGQVAIARFNLLTPEDLPAFRRRMREYCRGRLAPYKIPAKIEVVERTLYGERFKKVRGQMAWPEAAR